MTITKIETDLPQLPKLLRTAAYARVSADKDAMLHSLSAQVSYYSNLIQHNPEWEYVGVFADYACTGTKSSRAEWARLIASCRNGEIDLVITKSISRFARNTVDLLSVVRELKSLGTDVYFEEQNIHTLSSEGEFMLTLLASFAQEESRSVSENCKWRIRRDFAQGKLGYLRMLGYKMVDGEIRIIPEEAAVVREIFNDYLSGMGFGAISRKQRDKGFIIGRNTVVDLLKNEKLTGRMLLQKEFIENHITKRKKRNKGELPQYLVENSHEAIIPEETFQAVQREIAARAEKFHQKHAPKKYLFTGIITCGICGNHYKRKTANGRHYWNCSTFLAEGKAFCSAKQIPEETLERLAEEFGSRLKHIKVTGKNELSFELTDGSSHYRTWSDRSRSSNWTPAMKEKARQNALRQHEKLREGRKQK